VFISHLNADERPYEKVPNKQVILLFFGCQGHKAAPFPFILLLVEKLKHIITDK
jgi:hypothetical protein